jgi:hypothetical protein
VLPAVLIVLAMTARLRPASRVTSVARATVAVVRVTTAVFVSGAIGHAVTLSPEHDPGAQAAAAGTSGQCGPWMCPDVRAACPVGRDVDPRRSCQVVATAAGGVAVVFASTLAGTTGATALIATPITRANLRRSEAYSTGQHESGRLQPQTLKPSARSCSRPSSVILSGPQGGIQTQLIRWLATRPSRA